jgi:hypothetical protein
MPQGPPAMPPAVPHTPTTSAGASASLGTMAMPSAASGAPPAMPDGPPHMPGDFAARDRIPGATDAASLGTMAMPSAASGAPPAMPDGPPTLPSGPPDMPGDPAARNDHTTGVGAAASLGTLAMVSAVISAPPAMPGPSEAQVMATMAGSWAPRNLPPSLPPARYQLGAEIARGGMGRVVDATDTRLRRVVAFKEALTSDRDSLARFEREIRITARLEHPSIVPVHDAGDSASGSPFYVMRKVSGQPLERLVAGAETLGQRLALLPHIVDSAQALAHAHERGIVHRDIKPSNILVGDLGETVVIDWGLAKEIGEPDEPVGKPLVDLADTLKTRAGIVYGTPGFMAPEQLRGAPVDERCDVYALGATLYHLLSRKPPHHAKTADEMMKAAVAAPPTPIRELVEGVPPDLSTIVDKALAHDPTTRYQNARELAGDLQRFLTGQLVASHHYSPVEKLVRWVRRNRALSAAIAAAIAIATIAVIRIVIERNRADRAAAVAELRRDEAERRAEELTLSQARYNVDRNPTKAVAMIKPLAGKYWREARAIGAAAHAAGVAWSLPAAHLTRSLQMSRDGLRALSAGDDGVVRLHDLAARTTRPVIDLRVPVMARFADGDRRAVVWHDAQLSVVDLGTGPGTGPATAPATGPRRDLTAPAPILDLEVIGTTAYWVDQRHALWQLELAGAAPVQVPLAEPALSLVPSPDGRWIALAGEQHLIVYDRTRPADAVHEITLGTTHELSWSPDSKFLAAMIGSEVLAVQVDTEPAPSITERHMVPQRLTVAYHAGRLYTAGATGVVIVDESGDIIRKPTAGSPVGIVEARGGTMIAGASDGITVMSEDGDRILPLQAARIEGVAASPRSPYLLAQLEGRLLMWNLDDIQPRKLVDEVTGPARFADPGHVIAGGTLNIPAQVIDLATGAARPLGPWQDLRAVTSAGPGRAIAIIDGARTLHLVVPGREQVDLPGEVDIAGFATDNLLVLAAPDGALSVHDVARGQRAPLLAGHTPLLGLAWGHGRHPWIAAAFADGTLWRKNLATGLTQTAARVPRLDPPHPVGRDGKLLVAADGSVVFLHGSDVHTWRADGSLGRLARAPKPLEDLGEAGPDQILAIASDTTLYTIARGAPDQITEALASVEATAAAMSPDTGILIAVEHGALAILDPQVHQRWTLAPPTAITFETPAISADGRRVVANTPKSLLAWSIELPETAEATVRWLDAMTNAVDDRSPGGLGWR